MGQPRAAGGPGMRAATTPATATAAPNRTGSPASHPRLHIRTRTRLARGLWTLTLGLSACASQPRTGDSSPDKPASHCPDRMPAAKRLPGTEPKHLKLEYWLGRYTGAELDQVVLSTADVTAYNAAIGRADGQDSVGQRDLTEAPDSDSLGRSIDERLGYMREKLASGAYVTPNERPLSAPAKQAFATPPKRSRRRPLYVALADSQIRCGPYAGTLVTSDAGATGFDRNACSMLRSQEVVQELGVSPGGMKLVRTPYALGWLPQDAPLLPLPDSQRSTFVHGARVRAERDLRWPKGGSIAAHTTLPLASGDAVWVATSEGLVKRPLRPELTPTRRDITRRELLTEAFSFLGEPYGFGGQDGGRDCARFMMDLFGSFNLSLPRHSGWQAKAGTRAIDFGPRMSDADKLARIDTAAQQALVLLHLPGHIMLYLGRDDEGTPMVLHALGEYAQPCGEGEETVVDVRRTTVSDLELGRGSSRTSLIERVTRAVLLGPEERGVPAALPKPVAAKECRDSTDARIFRSPRKPVRGQPLRAIATVENDPGDVRLTLFDPDGNPVESHERVLGGPPYTRWVEAKAPQGGYYMAVLGSGDRTVACKRIPVRRHPQEPDEPADGNVVWQPSWKWERDTENLWSAFVEQLFEYPADDGRTWTNLHSLLRDRSRNLLHNYRGENEDEQLELQPDCADLPYLMRAYFAWKLELPFAFRQCSRGRPGRPPSCGKLRTPLEERVGTGDLGAFAHFANRRVRSGVHSASGRTHPDDNNTDYYPVALTRSSLRPGTVYADPYGHVMMLSKWYSQGPEGSGEYGILMASEAQPDGTVGRRRFWQGSFLFDSSTKHVGAGFKNFRPLVYDAEAGEIRSLDNKQIDQRSGFAAFSKQQYGLTKEAFYDNMDALINPRALDPARRMEALVDALEESVMRRITAVNNGEEFVTSRGGRPIDMPRGYSLFETTGPWEDFSTPARDMRLLVSIDTVVGFPAVVARNKQRFVVDGKAPDIGAIKQHLTETLKARSFEYTRSDGSAFTLTLKDVVDRAEAFEMAYNPNDCVELRWGAPKGSAESKPCKRHAPAEHRARMKEYRTWFDNRARPPRGTR